MSIEVIDPTSAAGIALDALDRSLAALRQVMVQASAAGDSAAAAAASQTAITALLQAVGVRHRWTGTSLQIMLPDGSYGPATDLGGPEGPVGPAPTFVVGQVSVGSQPSFSFNPNPNVANQYIVDIVAPQGAAGTNGWTPVLAVVSDGARRVLQVTDWTGGSGSKPATGLYVSASGLTATLASAVDIRGAAGAGSVSSTGTIAAGSVAVYADTTGQTIRSGVTLGGAAGLNVGTAAGMVAAGNDSRIVGAEQAANKGQANGYAPLDGAGKVPLAQLPASVVGSLNYQGTWNASTNTPTLASGVGTKGQYYKVATAGTTAIDGLSQWSVGDSIVFDGTTWDKLDGIANEVISVAGLFGSVSAAALKIALAIAANDVADATAIGKSVLTVASAAALTALSNAMVGDSGSGGTKGLAPAPASGDAAAGKFLKADGTWAAIAASAAYPITGTLAKSSAYTILTTDKGTQFDLTGSFALTLPAASGGSTSAALYYHFRKRDGSGRCTVAPNGTDIIEGANASIALYQERATLYSDGTGWRFLPGGREKVVYVVSPGTSFSSVSSIAALTGFDPDVCEVEINIDNLNTSSSTALIQSQLYQAGAYVTTGYKYAGSDGHGVSVGSDFSTSDTQIPLSASGYMDPAFFMSATITLRNIQSTTAGVPSVEVRGSIIATASSASNGFDVRGQSPLANAVSGIKIYPSTGTMSGAYSQRIIRA